MKNKVFNLRTRCLALFLSLLIMLSCIPAVALPLSAEGGAVSAPQSGTAQSGTSFKNGVYTVTIDTNPLFDMIDSGSVSLDGIKELIPAELLDALTQGGSVPERLIAILRAYINLATEGDSSKIFELLPVDMTIKYLTEGDDPKLWKIISKEQLMDSLDLVLVFEELNKSGRLSEIIDIDKAADIALNGGLVDENVINNIINDLRANDPEAYETLVGEVADIVLNNPDFENIRDSIVEKVAADDEAAQKLAALVRGDALNQLINNGDINIQKLSEIIDDEAIESLIESGAVKVDNLVKVIDDDTIEALIESGAINVEMLAGIVDDKTIEELISNDHVNVENLANIVDDDVIRALIDNNSISIKNLAEALSDDAIEKIIKDGSVDVEKLAEIVSDDAIEQLVKNDAVDFEKLAAIIRDETIDQLIKENVINIQSLAAVIGKNDLAALISNDSEKLLGFYNGLKPEQVGNIASRINTANIRPYLDTLDDEQLKQLAELLQGKMSGYPASPDKADLINYFEEHINEVAPAELFDAFLTVDSNVFVSFINHNILTDDDIVEAIGAVYIIESNIVDKNKVVSSIGAEALIDKNNNIVSVNDVIKTVGASEFLKKENGIVDLKAVIDVVGADELIKKENGIVDLKAVINAVGVSELIKKENKIVDLKAVIDEIGAGELVKKENDIVDLKTVIDVIGVSELIKEEKGIVDLSAVIDAVGASVLIKEENGIVDLKSVIDVVGASELIKKENGIVDVKAVIDAVGGIDKLISEGIVDEQMLMDEAGSLRDIALKMGADRLVEICGFNRILNAIGFDKLIANEEIAALVDYAKIINVLVETGLINTIDREALIASVDKAALVEQISFYIINFTRAISVNGEEIYNSLNGAKIDVNLLTQILAEAMPTFDKLAADPVNAFSFVVDWRLEPSKVDPATTKSSYSFGLEVKVAGDTERLAGIFKKLSGYVSIVNEGERTTVVINTPAKVAALYLKAVNTDKLPLELKTKILTYLNMEITEDNVQSVIADFTVEEIAKIIENVDFTRAVDVVDKLNGLYPNSYSRAIAIARRAVNALTYEKLCAVAEKLNIEKINDKLEDSEAGLEELRTKVLEVIEKMTEEELDKALRDGTLGDYSTLLADDVRANAETLNLIRDYISRAIDKAFDYAPDSILGAKLSNFYQGNGQFGPVNTKVSYDFLPRLEQLLSTKLPESAIVIATDFLKNTEITRDVTVQVTVADIYEAKFINLQGETVFVTYLPAGADLSAIYAVEALKDYVNGWTYDSDNTVATVMPAGDTRFTEHIPGHEHTMEFVEKVEPDCEKEGYELWRCTDKDCNFEEKREIVAALGHNYAVEWTIKTLPTLKKENIDGEIGEAVQICDRCKKIIKSELLPPVPDDITQTSRYGLTELYDGKCQDRKIACELWIENKELGRNDILNFTVNAPKSHTYGDWETLIEPNIDGRGGKDIRVCTVEHCKQEEFRYPASLDSSVHTFTKNNVTVSGLLADGKYSADDFYAEPEENPDMEMWSSAPGFENVGLMKVMDIGINGLNEDWYAPGFTLTISIEEFMSLDEFRERTYVIYHQLHDGSFEKFSTDPTDPEVDEDHIIKYTTVPTPNGDLPAIEFVVHSFSSFLAAVEHAYADKSWSLDKAPAKEGIVPTGRIYRECIDDFCDHIDEIILPKLDKNDSTYTYQAPDPEPDCVEGSEEHYIYTTADGQEFKFTVALSALEHDWGQWFIADMADYPTADKNGLLKRVCSKDTCEACVETITLPKLIPENKNFYIESGGSYDVIDPADCDSTGLDKYVYVIDGNNPREFEFTVVTAKLGHTEGDWEKGVDPTLEQPGTLVKKCEECTDVLDTHNLPALNKTDYTYSEKTPASCDAGGVDQYVYILIEGFVYEVATPKKEDHDWDAWTVTLDPTEESEGTLTRACKDFPAHTETHRLPALGEENGYSYAVEDHPSCEGTGTGVYTIVYDGQTFNFEVTLDATDHNYGEWTLSKKPTLTETGLIVRICANSDECEALEHVLPALNADDYTFTQKKPTCTEKGEDKYVYTHEGKSFTFTIETDALQHSFGEWTVTKTPTKDSEGTLTRVCANDDEHTESVTLPKLNTTDYTYSVVKESECGVKGEGKYTYTYAEQSFEFKVDIAEKIHSFGEWVITVAPTRDAEGKLTKICSLNSAHTSTYTLPKLDELIYNYTLITPATCTEKGEERFIFKLDGQTFEFTAEVAAKGHAFGEWTVITAPTLDGEGLLERVCESDETHKETHTVPALNAEDFEYVVVAEPLCQTKGSAKYIYRLGEEIFEFTVELSAKGHEFGEWTVGTAPALTAGGELVRSCKNDPEHKETHSIPSFNEGGDAYTYKVIKEPTETEPGSAVYTYTYDGVTFEFTVELSATGGDETDVPPVSGGDDESEWWWWLILIIIILVLIIILLVILLIIKHKKDKKPPEPQPAVQEAPAEPVIPIVPIVEEDDDDEDDDDGEDGNIPVAVARKKKREGKKTIVNIGDINAAFSEGETVSLETLKEKNLIPKAAKRYKVLSNGNIDKVLTVEADEFSPQAKEKILAAGGTVHKVRI